MGEPRGGGEREKGNRGRRQDEVKDKTYILLSVEKTELFAYEPDHNKSSLWGLEENMG